MSKNKSKTYLVIILLFIIIIGILIYYFINEKNNKIDIVDFNQIYETNEENIKNEIISQNNEKGKIKVYITGNINKSGVYEIEKERRIADVIEMAGGIKEGADLTTINLAKKVEDEMKIYIPSKDEEKNNLSKNQNNDYVTIGEISKTSPNIKININLATKEELQKLNGIGEGIAKKIIEYRNKNGKFKTIEEIKNVSGIGDSKYNKKKEFIIVN